MELKLFKSPTCGPCKMFEPQLKQAAKECNINLSICDVTTDEGLVEANKFNITNSGQAILINDNNIILYRWPHPVPAKTIIEQIKSI